MNPALIKILSTIFKSTLFQDIVKVISSTFVVELITLLVNAHNNTNSSKAVGQFHFDPQSFTKLMQVQESRGDLTGDSGEALSQLYADWYQQVPQAATILPLAYMWKYTGTLVDIVSGQLYQAYNDRYRPNPPPPDSLVQALRFTEEQIPGIDNALARNGISDADIALMRSSIRTPLDTATILQLYLNKTLAQVDAQSKLRENGLSDVDSLLYLDSTPGAPLPSTLQSLLLGSVVDDTIAAGLDLDSTLPDSVVSWFEANGLNKSWATLFWRGHFQLPPIDVFYSALNRGLLSAFNTHDYYKAIGIPPALYDIMDSLSTTPISMLQAAEALQNGIIDADHFRAYTRANGFSANDTEVLLQIAQTTLNANVTTSTITAIQYAVSDGFITDAQAIAWYQTIGYTQAQAEMQVQLAHYNAEYQYAQKALAAIEKGFKNQTLDGNQAVTEIISLGIQPAQANGYITLWTTEVQNSQNTPSLTDVEDMVKYKIITLSQAATYIKKLGYSTTDATNLAALIIARNGG